MSEEKSKASEQIYELIGEAKAKIKQACDIADEHQISFTWSLGYGMGGMYMPTRKPMTRKQAIARLGSSEYIDEDEVERLRAVLQNTTHDDDDYDAWESSTETGWVSSSSQC